MYCIFLFIILAFNYLHRLQSIISEIFVLVTVIITFLNSPVYFSFDYKIFSQIFSVKNYLFDHVLYVMTRCQSSKDMFNDDFFLKNYFFYQKKIMEGTLHVYVVSNFTKTFAQVVSNNKAVEVDAITSLLQQYPILKNLKFGQVIFLITAKGYGLQSLLWQVSSKETRIYNRVAHTDTFMENVIIRFDKSCKCYYVLIIGRLHDNFVNSVRALGLDNHNIQIMINALEWQLNFHKLRQGDKFSILIVCSKSFSDQNIDNMNRLIISAVCLHSMGKDYYAFRADNGRFYNREAVGVIGDFIRFPIVKPCRVSSNFSLSRLNPITGRISPHFGVDFAVPIGTPVLSIGDGEVMISKYGQVPGNYIVIRHGSCCISRYMHLHRLLVKPGQIVKKGENIAFSGNTGRSTGPHLHFEVWINRKPVNPLTTTFLNIEKLTGYDRINYINKINIMLSYLHFNQ